MRLGRESDELKKNKKSSQKVNKLIFISSGNWIDHLTLELKKGPI